MSDGSIPSPRRESELLLFSRARLSTRLARGFVRGKADFVWHWRAGAAGWDLRAQTNVPENVQTADKEKASKLQSELATIEEAIAAFKKLQVEEQ
eukprot:1181078-Prorocentrum_minimum.AAC.2